MQREGRQHPATRRQRALRYLGDAFLVGGLARGANHGDSARAGDHFAARAGMLHVARQDADADRQPGLLDRVPGWVLLAMLALIAGAAWLLPR